MLLLGGDDKDDDDDDESCEYYKSQSIFSNSLLHIEEIRAMYIERIYGKCVKRMISFFGTIMTGMFCISDLF